MDLIDAADLPLAPARRRVAVAENCTVLCKHSERRNRAVGILLGDDLVERFERSAKLDRGAARVHLNETLAIETIGLTSREVVRRGRGGLAIVCVRLVAH